MPHKLVMEVARNEFMPQLAETLSERTWGWVWMVDTSTQALCGAKKKVEEVGTAAWATYVRETLRIPAGQKNDTSKNTKTYSLLNHPVAFPLMQLASRFSYYQSESVLKIEWLMNMHKMPGKLTRDMAGFVSNAFYLAECGNERI